MPLRYSITVMVSGLGLGSQSPFDYPDTIWRSTEPEIEIVISEDPNNYIAKMNIDGRMTPVRIVIDPSQCAVVIFSGNATPGNYLIEGEIQKSTSQELLFSVARDYCFSGKYKSIVLFRER